MKKYIFYLTIILITLTTETVFAKNEINTFKVDYKNNKIIEDGRYRIAINRNENMGIDVDAGSKDNCANVLLWEWYEEDNIQKKFDIKYDETDGYYTIINANSNKALDVKNAGMLNGTNVWQYEENGTDAQKWKIIKNTNGSYSFVSKLNGLYLDIENGNISNGANVQVYEGNNTQAQQFSLIKTKEQIEKTIEDGIYVITSSIDKNKSFDVTDSSKENNITIQLWDYCGFIHQKFKITYNKTYYTISSINSNKVLAINNNNQLIQKEAEGLINEKWIIEHTEDNKYSFISMFNNFCIDIPSANAYNGAKLQVYKQNNTEAQKFSLINKTPIIGEKTVEDGDYRIVSPIDNLKAFDVVDGMDKSGTKIQLWDEWNAEQQKFEIIYTNDGCYKIRSKLSNKVLTVESENPSLNSNITQEEDKDLDTQKWIIKDLNSGLYSLISKCANLYITLNDIPQNGELLKLSELNNMNSQKFILINETPKENIATIEDGVYQISLKNNMTFDINGASYENYANLQIWTNDKAPQKKFRITRMQNSNYYTITAIHSKKAIDVQNGGINIGTNVNQFEQNNTDNQYWYFKDCGDGYYNIISKANGLYVDIAGGMTTNCGTNVQLYYSNNSDAQKFKLNKVNIIENGIYEIETKLDSSKVLDIDGGLTNELANLQIWTADNVKQQRFIIKGLKNDCYQIIAQHSEKALTVGENGNVYQEKYTGKDTQKWKIQEAR